MLVIVAAIGLALTVTRLAGANGRFPQSNAIVFSPHDPTLVMTRATFGLLISHDDGVTWPWVCESAIGISAQEDPSYGLTEGDAIVGGLWEGVSVSSDTGCNWAFAGGALAGQHIVDLVVRADDPHAVLVLSGTWLPNAAPPDGGDIYYQSQVFQTTDDGAHWSALGVPIDPSVTVSTLEVAPSDPTRFYVSGTRGSGAGLTAQLFVSTNSGATWTERAVPLIPSIESAFYIGAVDPTNSDLVYLRTDIQSRLLVTTNAGASFQVSSFVGADGGTAPSLAGAMYGFALSPDGATIYAGGTGVDGLFVGARGATSLVHRSNIDVVCLAARSGELWACSDQASGLVVGVSTDNGATFAPRFQLDQVAGVLQCGADATVAQCEAQYPAQCKLLDGCAGSDGGVDGGEGAGSADAGTQGQPADRSGSGGCSVRGGVVPVWFGLGFIALTGGALVLVRRRPRT
jgi:hypothetical protein